MLNSITNYLSGGVERSLMAIGGVVGAAFSFAFGDVAPLMLWLAILCPVDDLANVARQTILSTVAVSYLPR